MEVTERQKEYIEAIRIFWRKNLRPPSMSDLARQMGRTRGAPRFMMMKLEEMGLATWEKDATRTIKTTGLKCVPYDDGTIVMWG